MWSAVFALGAAFVLWVSGILGGHRRPISVDPPKSCDFLIVGGGPSGCYLAMLIAKKYLDASICLVNIAGSPPSFWKLYMVNLVGVIFPWLVPSVSYTYKSHSRQFLNATYIGGNTNVNAGVGPVPTEEEIVDCLGEGFREPYRKFLASGELNRLSTEAPTYPGLENLSKMLNAANVRGGRIRTFSKGFSRIHPEELMQSFKNITIAVAKAEKLSFADDDRKVTGAFLESGHRIEAKRKVFLCCGAIETPKLAIRSGVGPSHVLEKLNVKSRVANKHVGANLQDHWVGRASAVVPTEFSYPYFYPALLGYKHRFGDVAVGFGKLQMLGRNLMSFATTTCKNPGRIIVTAEGNLEPFLPVGLDDIEAYNRSLENLIEILRSQLGIIVKPKDKPLSPNWHLSCTMGVGTCVNERNFEICGLKGAHVADVSVLRQISPMNTQVLSYAVPFMMLENMK